MNLWEMDRGNLAMQGARLQHDALYLLQALRKATLAVASTLVFGTGFC